MKRFLILALMLLGVSFANAQGIQQCYTTTGTNCIQVSPTNPLPTTVLNAADITIGAVTGTGTAGTAAANPITIQGIASMTPVTVTPSGTVTVQVAGASFTNITTATDTNVKASAGTLVGLIVNTGGAGSSALIYNDADGTCNTALIGTFSTATQTSLQINAAATTGICVKTQGGTPADITVLYR